MLDLNYWRYGDCLGMASARAAPALEEGLLSLEHGHLSHTETGWRFVNNIQALFLPDDRLAKAGLGR